MSTGFVPDAPASGFTPDAPPKKKLKPLPVSEVPQTPFQKGLADILRRTSSASASARVHGLGAGLQTLLHSNAPEENAADLKAITRSNTGVPLLGPISAMTGLGMVGGMSQQEYNAQPQWARDFMEKFSTPTTQDPLTVLGATGATRALTQRASESILPVAMRATAKAAALPGIPGRVAEAAAHVGGKLHDFVTPGGANAAAAERELALQHGRQGVQIAQQLYALRGMGKTVGSDLEHTLSRGLDQSLNGLSESDQLRVSSAIHRGTIDSLPDNLRAPAQQLQQFDRAIPWLFGSKSLRSLMTKRYDYSLPPELQRFDQGPLGFVKTSNFEPNHIPLIHELSPETAENIVAGSRGKIDVASAHNPQFLRRRQVDPDEAIPLTSAKQVKDAFASSFSRAGRAWGGAQIQREVAQRFATPRTLRIQTPTNTGAATAKRFSDVPVPIRKFFTTPAVEPGNAALHQLAQDARSVSNIGRSSIFVGGPLPHMGRIASLGLLHGPEAIPGAIGKFAKMGAGFASPETHAAVLGAARKAGAAGVPSLEGAGDLNKALDWLGGRAEAGVKRIMPARMAASAKYSKFAKLASIPTTVAKHWFGGVSKALWTWDDAMKASLFEKNLRTYGDPLRAAFHTQKSLVDYGISSKMTETARFVSSFPTWRTRMPAAVLKGITENPQNLMMLARLGTLIGIGPAAALGVASFSAGGKERKLSMNAIGEAMQVASDPQGYTRGSLSPSGHIAAWTLSELSGHGKGNYPNYWTYGQNPAMFALKSLPGINQGSQYAGQGMFKSTPGDEALQQLTGVQTMEPR